MTGLIAGWERDPPEIPFRDAAFNLFSTAQE